MAVTVLAIVPGPIGCQHVRVTVDVDGRKVEVDLSQNIALATDDNLVQEALNYHIQNKRTAVVDLVGKIIVPNEPQIIGVR